MAGERVVIDRRFCGFPQWAHGAYVSGLLARHIGPSADVRLRRPIPLEYPLDLERTDGGAAALRAEGALFAEGHSGIVDVSVPDPLTLDEVQAAAKFYPADRHRIPGCFVCGTHRPDGLQVFPAPVWERDVVSAVWTPRPELVDPDGYLRTEFVWAVLDCTEAWALIMGAAPASGERAVTG